MIQRVVRVRANCNELEKDFIMLNYKMAAGIQ